MTVDGQAYFAAYQFDTVCQPQPVIHDILAALGPVTDTWKIAAWFHFPNGWIIDERAHAVAPKNALDRSQEVSDGETLLRELCRVSVVVLGPGHARQTRRTFSCAPLGRSN